MVPTCGSIAVLKMGRGYVGGDAVVEGLTGADGNGITDFDEARSINFGRYLKYALLYLAYDAKSSAIRYPVYSSYTVNMYRRLRCSCATKSSFLALNRIKSLCLT